MKNADQTPSLYCSDFEHDACGVGFVCSIRHERSHAIVEQGLTLLINLDHRGACGCDANTGDGAGILIQMPDRFLRAVSAELGFDLPEAGRYGAGMVFLPRDEERAATVRAEVDALFEAEGFYVLGWRRVPVDNTTIGTTARSTEPSIWQVFVGSDRIEPGDLERKLFVVRKLIERAFMRFNDGQFSDGRDATCYVASLSTRTLVYKGMLTTFQLGQYFPDLLDERLESGLAMVHSRFSTNTFPRWPLAQPFRMVCHNGEINTLRGNLNWMKAREVLFQSDRFGEDIKKITPILTEGGSDSMALDTALELLCHTGRSLPQALMMLIPEAWERHEEMTDEKRAFYEYNACFMEPWDGPATVPFTDGRYIGAVLDRNGLRPSRYTVTCDGLVVLASETGVLSIDPAKIVKKGRLKPGRMFLVDLEAGRIIEDDVIKHEVAARRPYRAWLNEQIRTLDDASDPVLLPPYDEEALRVRQQLHGYTQEDLRLIMTPMGVSGKEAIGSMGDDTPLAVLSEHPRLLFDYFKQLFAQVTNPPLDAIREKLVTALQSYVGPKGNLFEETPEHAHQLRLPLPVLSDEQIARLKGIRNGALRATTLPMYYDVTRGGEGLRQGLDALCEAAGRAVDAGYSLIVLSDRDADEGAAPIPSLLAVSAVHHALIRNGKRLRTGLILESGEPREVHHFCLLLGFGVDAVNPYLALQTLRDLPEVREVVGGDTGEISRRYIRACAQGVLKVMSKMGISTLYSYRGAQIFEAIGLARDVIDRYFTGTTSRLGGIGLDVIAEEAARRYYRAFPEERGRHTSELRVGGRYQWRRNGESHQYNPLTIARLQQAVRTRQEDAYAEFAREVNENAQRHGTIRGLLQLKAARPGVPIEEVEPWNEIVRRFKTGAMSYGSISRETHETLAVAMNTLGGKSNTGEGGEDPDRYDRANMRRSRIKQVASGRFGVTISYLASADEIQIKMAQGAKPGEGGQLPGEKVYPWIARVRHSTPYVGLISPPPHHDIYSIEDLAQLIFDLKNSNPGARVTVKLVSEVGVGTVAAGVAKGKADVVLISGHDGGTGASPTTSIAHAGLPWEMGLSETHQTLVRNGLRSRIRVECDGHLKTGRDVAIAALLGADEFGFATAPLVALGCIMMRKCHLNTCPVGIATQDPVLREKFNGVPEYVINYFYFVAQELRAIMAELGFRTVGEMVGEVESLTVRDQEHHWKARHLDLRPILVRERVPEQLVPFCTDRQEDVLENVVDHWLIEQARPALERKERVALDMEIHNRDRTFGTMLSNQVATLHGEAGLPEDTIHIFARGSAGQSFAAFGAPGLTFEVEGDANDYYGKGLSGARLVIRPPEVASFVAEDNIIIGNVALYGATSGEVYIRGRAGERFGVRNSGAHAVVEGVGDHGCEYMTGGRVVVLGATGRNFAAGMSGGIAYVYDPTGQFARQRCNTGMVTLYGLDAPEDISELMNLIGKHYAYTGSQVAARILDNPEDALRAFVKVYPDEYRKALERLQHEPSEHAEQVEVAA